MNYSYKKDRALRSKLRRARPYQSRASLRNRSRVDATVRRFATGLGQFDPTEERIEDKYYVKEAFPPRDVATEAGLGTFGLDPKHAKLLVLAAAIFIGYKYLTA